MVTIDNVDRINLILNGGFELGLSGWDVAPGVGGLVAADDAESADAGSGHSLSLEYTVPDEADASSDPGLVSQTLDPALVQHLRGRLLSFQIRICSDTKGALRAFISTDGGETKSYGAVSGQSYDAGWPGDPEEIADRYETLSLDAVSLPDGEELTGVVFGVEVGASCHAHLDNASLVFGSASVAAGSCVPAGVLGYLSKAEVSAPVAASRTKTPDAVGRQGASASQPKADGPKADGPKADGPKADGPKG